MAASNYYGFPHAAVAPPYSTPPVTAYCHPATAATYAVQQVPGVTPAYAPLVQAVRPVPSIAYGAYPTHAADYGYGTRQTEVLSQPVTTPNYQDTYSYGRATAATAYENKQYYQPVATQAVHNATDSYYQAGSKGGYSQSSSGYTQPQRQVTTIKTVQTVNATPSSYVVYPVVTTVQQSVPASTIPSYTPSSTYNSTPASYSGTSYTSYDPSVYSAANTYYHQPPPPPPPQQQQQPLPSQQHQSQKSMVSSTWSNTGNSTNANPVGNFNKKLPFQNKQLRPKGPPKQPQIHYCDICKISCAGPQTYSEHLEGQKHKKKEAVQKTGSPTTTGPRGVQAQLRCELCVVSCTGADAYAAHIRGSKHQKVVKLHTKLGKPIPSIDLVNSVSDTTTTTTVSTTTTVISPASKPTYSTIPMLSSSPVVIAVNSTSNSSKPTPLTKAAPSKITLVGSTKPTAIVVKPQPLLIRKEPLKVTLSKPELQIDNFTQDDFGDNLSSPTLSVNPVGHEFVEEVCNDEGKIIRFHCKLCECSFNDPNAKDMHLKGRRHRLQFKKKVNPQFPVEIKPSNRARKLQEEKMKKLKQKDMIKQRREDDHRFTLERRRYEQDMYWRRAEEEKLYWEEQRRRRTPDWHPPPLMGRPGLPVPPLLVGNHFNIRGFERRDGKMPRIPRLFCLSLQCDSPHQYRRPESFEDRYIMFKHSQIYPTEEELQSIQKIVSHSERSLKLVSDSLTEQDTDVKEEKEESREKGKRNSLSRCLKGVMRVGVLAKGLLLRGDRYVDLIVLSDQKPTTSILQKIAELLPKQLSAFTQDKYEVSFNVEESYIIIASCKEPKMQVLISIASPVSRDDEGDKVEDNSSQPEPPDLISKKKCMNSLAALRHAKWFQARANGLQSCVIVIRILKDLCQRVPTWSALPHWAMELLVEKALSSVSGHLGPGDALRRVLECIASGILLTGGPGLQDPCEKEAMDALETMTSQEREDVTASAQHALRMVAFRQIYKVLGIEPFPPSKHKPSFYNRKRRRDTTEVEVDGLGDGKKDKKDDAKEM